MSDEETNILATVTPVIYLLLDRLVIVWAGGNRIPVKRGRSLSHGCHPQSDANRHPLIFNDLYTTIGFVW